MYVCMYALFVCIYGQIRERQLSFSDRIGKNEKGENPVFSSPAKMPIKPCLQCIHPQFCDEAAIKQPVSHTEQCRSTSLVTGTHCHSAPPASPAAAAAPTANCEHIPG